MSEISFTFKTIERPSTFLHKERGSKFFAFSFPVQTVSQTKEYLDHLKNEHPKATHHCFAFRIGTDGTLFRVSDDGEPSGTAGKPILGQIDSFGLTDVLVVVVRYFGGSLLGVPGLIAAYRAAAAGCLEGNEVVEKNVERTLELEFDYPVVNEVQLILKQFNATIHEREMLLFCRFRVGLPLQHIEECLAQLENIRGLQIREQA